MPLVRLMRHPFPTRAEAFDARPSWADLASRISKIFDIQLESVAVAYVDEANETYVVSNELALLECYDSISEAVEIKFVVVDVKQYDSEFATYSGQVAHQCINSTSSWSSKSHLSNLVDPDDTRKLTCCSINTPWIFSAEIRKDKTVDELKKVLKVMMEHENPYDTLGVWKASPPIPSSEVARVEHAESIEQVPDLVELSNPFDKIDQHFSASGEDTIQIVLQTQTDRPPKRRKLDDELEVAPAFRMLWEQTWHRNDEVVPWFTLTQSLGEHAIPVPEHYWVFSPPKDIAWALELSASSVLVREDYTRALNRLFECSGWTDFVLQNPVPDGIFYNPFSNANPPHKPSKTGFILMGYPGIGKSVWLRILLVLRLCARLPTFYQIDETRTLLFTEKGVEVITLNSAALDRRMKEEHTAWALVDSTLTLKIPPPQFMNHGIFVVHTPSSRSECLEWRKKYIGVELYCLSLWSLPEIICAAPFQKERHDENSLIDFCNKYGFSARDAYSNVSKAEGYEKELKSYCNSLKYETVSDLVLKMHTLHFPDKLSHKIICMTPAENEVGYSFTFTSSHVYERLLESLSASEADAASKMYRLFLKIGETKSVSGFMLEPAMHCIIGSGGVWEVVQLVKSEGPKNNHWKTPKDPSVSWLHFTAEDISVDASDEDTSLNEGKPRSLQLPTGPFLGLAYYRPRSKSQATFDAAVYDPVTMHGWIFQSAASEEHSVNVSGINDLLERGVTQITFIAVTPPGQTIDLLFPKGSDDMVVFKYQLQLV